MKIENSLAAYVLKTGFVCLFVFYVPSTARSLRDGTPIYCPLLGKYTVPSGKRTLGRRMAVHYVTTAPRRLYLSNAASRYNLYELSSGGTSVSPLL